MKVGMGPQKQINTIYTKKKAKTRYGGLLM